MSFIPHTNADVAQMLETIGASSINDLFAEIPANLRNDGLPNTPDAISELELMQHMQARAEQDGKYLNFIGAGAYEHHIATAAWDIATRGEFMTAYTPYQAEASQGTLQLIYEFQTNITQLTGLDAANASLYDGASGLAEAVLMAVRANRKSKSKRVLVPENIHPHYRKVLASLLGQQGIELCFVPFDGQGNTNIDALQAYEQEDVTALVIAQPNFFGQLESVHDLTDWAHAKNALVIGLVNPIALMLCAPPGQWGTDGADIAVGDGQPLGVPLASGGPYYGFLACKQAYVRQMPGRIIGRTVDLDGKPGYTLTLQAREQHIRRSKATSNICTNQGLAVTASTIHMAIMGSAGLEQVAKLSHHRCHQLVATLCQIPGVERVFSGDFFHECLLRLPKPVASVTDALSERGILAGFATKVDYPDLGECLLVCATETKTEAELTYFANALTEVLSTC